MDRLGCSEAALHEGSGTAQSNSEVRVWYQATEQVTPVTVAKAGDALSYDERAQRDKFGSAADRRDYVLAHALLRQSLSYCYPRPPGDWIFHKDIKGKPSVAPLTPRLSFSLSHCHGFVGCAVATNAVGVDVERLYRVADVRRIAERCFAPTEIAQLARCSDTSLHACFTELWTLKEAFVKATGAGISDAWRSLSFNLEQPGVIEFTADHEAARWAFALFAAEPHIRLAVAALCNECEQLSVAVRPCDVADKTVLRCIRANGCVALSGDYS
jgi:phosphopantetheine--protein transferase-like protein